jgi:very-short-patch-repair endonuclease
MSEARCCIADGYTDERAHPETTVCNPPRPHSLTVFSPLWAEGLHERETPSPQKREACPEPPVLWRPGERGWGEPTMSSRHTAQRTAVLGCFAQSERRAPTDAEKRLWYLLRGRRLVGHKFRCQHYMPPYVAGFTSIARRLTVELDGREHSSTSAKAWDFERTQRLTGHGPKIIRSWNHDVMGNTEGMLDATLSTSEMAPHPSHLPIRETEPGANQEARPQGQSRQHPPSKGRPTP